MSNLLNRLIRMFSKDRLPDLVYYMGWVGCILFFGSIGLIIVFTYFELSPIYIDFRIDVQELIFPLISIGGITSTTCLILSFFFIDTKIGKRNFAFQLIPSLITSAIFLFIFLPLILNPPHRPYVSRTRSEQQSLATAIESYYIDYQTYPLPDYDIHAHTVLPTRLTTPIAYVTSLFHDRFKDNGRGLYEYGVDTVTQEWIVTSYGPDKEDGTIGIKGGVPLIEDLAVSDKKLGFSLRGSGFTYDPTNGTTSSGDIWRRGP